MPSSNIIPRRISKRPQIVIITDCGKIMQGTGKSIDPPRHRIAAQGIFEPHDLFLEIISAPPFAFHVVASLGATVGYSEIVQSGGSPSDWFMELNCAPRVGEGKREEGRNAEGERVIVIELKNGLRCIGFEDTLWPFKDMIKAAYMIEDTQHGTEIFRSKDVMIRVMGMFMVGKKYPYIKVSILSPDALHLNPETGSWIIGYDNFGNVITNLRADELKLNYGNRLIIKNLNGKRVKYEFRFRDSLNFSHADEPTVTPGSLKWLGDSKLLYLLIPLGDRQKYHSAREYLGDPHVGARFDYEIK